MTDAPASIHACAVLVGTRALLIRGPAGSGKSRLALALIENARDRPGCFARLVSDDRVHVEARHGRLVVRAPQVLRGLIEVRGLGIRRLPSEASAVVGLVIDLAAADFARLPEAAAAETEILGVRLARLAVAPGEDPLPPVQAFLHTERGDV